MATETDLEGIKRRVKKLLALSKSPNENEALAALEKARALMDEYHLTEGECRYVRYDIPATKRLSRWRMVLADGIAPLYCCMAARCQNTRSIVFYGDSFDAFMAGEMYRYLSKTIDRMTAQNVRRNARLAYREKYRLGVACRLAERMRLMGQEASWVEEHGVRLLAVKKAAETELQIETEEMTIGGTGDRVFRRGMNDGDSVSLNRQATGRGGRYLEGVKK